MDSPFPKDLVRENNIYLFMEEFKNETVKPLIHFILEKNLLPKSKRPDHIKIMINSPGGSVHAAFSLIDIIKGSKIPVHTVGLGLIASCGLLLFMSGAKGSRVITPNTSILSHQYSWGSSGKEHELFAVVKEFEMSSSRLIEHYKKCTGMNEKTVREILLPSSDLWMNPKEAVKYGIADKIVKSY